MKSDTQYRFSLSWGMETEENILAGEFLEKLGISTQIETKPDNSPENTNKTEGISSMLENLSAWKL